VKKITTETVKKGKKQENRITGHLKDKKAKRTIKKVQRSIKLKGQRY